MGFLFVCFGKIEKWQEDIYFSLNQQILALNISGGFHNIDSSGKGIGISAGYCCRSKGQLIVSSECFESGVVNE